VVQPFEGDRARAGMERRVVQLCKGDRARARMEQEWKDGVSSLVKATGQEQE